MTDDKKFKTGSRVEVFMRPVDEMFVVEKNSDYPSAFQEVANLKCHCGKMAVYADTDGITLCHEHLKEEF